MTAPSGNICFVSLEITKEMFPDGAALSALLYSMNKINHNN